MNKKKIGWILALLGAMSIGLAFVFTDYFWWWFLPGVLPYVIFASGHATRCPKCNHWWVADHKSSQVLDRWIETRDVQREDITRDRSGHELYRTTRTEQVIITCEKIIHYYSCEYCNNNWTKIEVNRNR